MKRPHRQLVLNKGDERYIFRCRQGHENELFRAVIDQVRDGQTGLDWLDAAVIGFELAQSAFLIPEC